MNRKILAVLLFCPVIAFTADKMIGINDAKEPAKGKTSEKILVPSPGQESPKATKKEVTYVNQELVFVTRVNSEELVNEMKKTIQDRETREAAFYSSEYTGTWDDRLTKDETKFLKSQVIRRLEKHNICSIDLKESFSRCPSGYNAYVIVNNNQPTQQGWLVSNSGCDSDPITMFRYDVALGKVEAKVSDKAGYVTLDDFFRLYKSAKKSL
jgi:hypothetical protein